MLYEWVTNGSNGYEWVFLNRSPSLSRVMRLALCGAFNSVSRAITSSTTSLREVDHSSHDKNERKTRFRFALGEMAKQVRGLERFQPFATRDVLPTRRNVAGIPNAGIV